MLLTVAVNVVVTEEVNTTENFSKAPQEKQLAVINAGFACFARDGYQKTAMSEIAKAAGVSKASLFHYFGTKKELYFFLFRFSCDEIGSKIPKGSNDFFECIDIGTKTKFAVMEHYPNMYDFLVSVIKNTDAETEVLLREANARAISEGIKTLFANVDWSRFRPDVSREDAVSLVNWVTEGYLRDNAEKPRDTIMMDIQRYLNLSKQALYREEYL
jgi:AcrR family transcriptional regulator